MQPSRLPSSFTTIYESLVDTLTNTCRVSNSWDPFSEDSKLPMMSVTAIWDTGATHSVISQRVVDECGLIPEGMTDVYHAQGRAEEVPMYSVNIELPNEVMFPGLLVTLGDFLGGDVLIGMDIIGAGDFAVTNNNGATKFSYRYPSSADIDFVREDRGVGTTG